MDDPALTIRAATVDGRLADTLAGKPVIPRGLPLLSVDLRWTADAAAPHPASQPDLEVRGVIGEGGMGRVLLVRQHSPSRDVAVKTAKDDAQPGARDSILSEGAIAGQLEHPAIVPVHALGLDAAGRPALVMKRIEGVAWDALIADPSHPGWEGWEGDAKDRLPGHLQILMTVSNAIHFAHSRAVVHRDIKPENVLIGRYGDVYLSDWGVATQITGGPSELCGTPAFMAPEMVSGAPVDARTDVYLLGSTLHRLLAGAPRHSGSSISDALVAARRSEPFVYAPSVAPELAALANRACHPDPSHRPQTAQDFRDGLRLYLRHSDARSLADQAIQRAAEVDTLLALEAPDAGQQQQIERRLAESRFGLEQALTLWKENGPAQQALAKLEVILEQRRLRTVALEQDARERDPAIGLGARLFGIVCLFIIDLAIAIVALVNEGHPTPRELAMYPLVVVVPLVGGLIVLRKRMLRSKFNQETVACMVIGVGMILVGRLLGLLVDIPVHEHFVRDSFALAALLSVMAIAYLRWIGWIAVTFAVSGVIGALFPALALRVFSVSTVIAMGLGVLVTWRSARQQSSRRA